MLTHTTFLWKVLKRKHVKCSDKTLKDSFAYPYTAFGIEITIRVAGRL